MPQEFHVVQCYNCETFQVDIVKKVTKWSCKMCGEKQSIKKIFDKGDGKTCRLHVQKLNEMRIKVDSVVYRKQPSPLNTVTENEQRIIKSQSKWSLFTNNFNNEEEYASEGNKVDKEEKKRMLDDHSILDMADYKKKPEEVNSSNKKLKTSKWNEFLHKEDIENKNKCENEKLCLEIVEKKNTKTFQSSQPNFCMFELENEVLDDFLKL